MQLSQAETALLSRCDGSRTVRELTADLASMALPDLRTEIEVSDCLLRWQDDGLLKLGFEGPIETWPEETLRRKLERIGDLDLRDRQRASEVKPSIAMVTSSVLLSRGAIPTAGR